MESDYLKRMKSVVESNWQKITKAGILQLIQRIEILEREISSLRARLRAEHRGKHSETCVTCSLADFRQTNGGRRMLDQPGKCGVIIKLPHSFTDVMNKIPGPHYITKHTLRGCPYHSKVK